MSSGWYLASLGVWSMLYTPIHFAVFLIICALLPTLLYSAYLLQTLYLVLGEAYIDVSFTSFCYEKYGETECGISSLCYRGGERRTTMMTTWRRRNHSTSEEFQCRKSRVRVNKDNQSISYTMYLIFT